MDLVQDAITRQHKPLEAHLPSLSQEFSSQPHETAHQANSRRRHKFPRRWHWQSSRSRTCPASPASYERIIREHHILAVKHFCIHAGLVTVQQAFFHQRHACPAGIIQRYKVPENPAIILIDAMEVVIHHHFKWQPCGHGPRTNWLGSDPDELVIAELIFAAPTVCHLRTTCHRRPVQTCELWTLNDRMPAEPVVTHKDRRSFNSAEH